MHSKLATIVYTSITGWFYERRLAKEKQRATVIPEGMLFQPDGWGPVGKDRLPLPAPKIVEYPAPDYAEFSDKKTRPSYTDTGKDMCNRGRSQWARGRIRQAESYYSRAIELCPSNSEFMFEQAQLLWATGKLEEAKRLLARALEIKPDFTSARVSLFRLCMLQGDFQTPRENWSDIDRDRDYRFSRGIHRALHDQLRPHL